MKRVLCAGLALADILVSPVNLRSLEQDSIPVSPPLVAPGGDALNQAIILRRLGVDCGLACSVGDDFWGDFLISTAQREGISTEHIERRRGEPTSTSVILIEPSGERHFLTTRGASDRFTLLADEPLPAFDILSIASLWGLAGIGPQELGPLCMRARSQGIKIAADFTEDLNGMGVDFILDALPHIDYLFPSYAEGVRLTRKETPDDILCALADMGAKHIVLKLGAQGAIALVDGKFYQQSALAASVVDTTGAGDNFVAAYLACIARGMPVSRCMRTAARASARCVSAVGATSARFCFEDISPEP